MRLDVKLLCMHRYSPSDQPPVPLLAASPSPTHLFPPTTTTTLPPPFHLTTSSSFYLSNPSVCSERLFVVSTDRENLTRHPFSSLFLKLCLPAAASASFSQNPQNRSCKRAKLTPPDKSSILNRPGKSSRHSSKSRHRLSCCPPHGPVLYLPHRAYAARMSFYRLKQFQCEVTGKSGLDYFQAIESERQEARTLHSRFSEPLKPAVLRAVQWRTFSNLCRVAAHSFIRGIYSRGHGPFRPLGGSRL